MPEQSAPLMQLGEARPLTVPVLPAGPAPGERARLERRTRLLAWVGIGWHVVEFAIGLAASSIALIGFGADSLIEALAGGVVLWLFTGKRRGSHTAERRAQQLIAVSFFLLAGYVGVEALRTLVDGDHPAASWVGIGLAAFTAPTMPLLAYAKRRLGLVRMRSPAGGGPTRSLRSSSPPSRSRRGARAGAAKDAATPADRSTHALLRRAPQ